MAKGSKIKHTTSLNLVFTLFIGMHFPMPAVAGWESQWIDRFDGAGVNWNNWTAQVQANFNNEVQCYTDDDVSADKNYDVSGGTLKIIARRQDINCPGQGGTFKQWTSGRLNSKDKREFLYGRIESRIRFLDLNGGTWPAFWMLENRIAEDPIANDNDFVNWPNPGAGEIDVWEWFSNDSTRYITNFFNTSGCGGLNHYNYPGGASDVQQWHDYAIEWDANAISFFVDDTLVATQNMSGCAQYKEPMFVLLNVAMGGNLGGSIDPTLNMATMEVDYIAHCNPSNSNTATRCNESTPGVPAPTPGNLIIFNDFERSDWVAWDASGGTTPTLVVDSDMLFAEAMQFSINGSTVVGFNSRAPFATAGAPFDASGLAATGTLEFDLKMTNSPGATDWKLKVESNAAATEVELNLSSSNEAHASALLNVWQHYSFNLSDLATLGLDLSAIDLVMVFPEYGTGDGAVFRIDNVKILGNVPQAAPIITSNPPTSIFANNLYSYRLTASDADGDPLTMTAPILPGWLSFDSATALLSGSPSNAVAGTHNVTLRVSDGSVDVDQAFTVTVVAVQAPGDITGSAGSFGLLLMLFLGSLSMSRFCSQRSRQN